MVLGYYFFLVTGLHFFFFKRTKLYTTVNDANNAKTGLLKRIIDLLNAVAHKTGIVFTGGGKRKILAVNRRILEILEYEKNLHITPHAFIGYKTIISLLLLIAGVCLGNGLIYRLLIGCAGAIAGYFIPDFMIKRYSIKISEDIEKELSYVIDLLRISSLSGQNIYNSFKMLIEKYNGRICGDLKNFIRDIDMGAGKDYAYDNLIHASRSDQFREFVSLLMEADRYGSPIDDILSKRSVHINHENWDNAERKAKKVGLLTLVPLVFFILPAFILLVGGPLIFSLASDLFF